MRLNRSAPAQFISERNSSRSTVHRRRRSKPPAFSADEASSKSPRIDSGVAPSGKRSWGPHWVDQSLCDGFTLLRVVWLELCQDRHRSLADDAGVHALDRSQFGQRIGSGSPPRLEYLSGRLMISDAIAVPPS